jgi:formylglycine-generating enzyme required for sulfatase activity
MSHVFISYSKKDWAYARHLADELLQRGFDVWIDDQIDYGEDWWPEIVQAIRGCGAFIVAMTPDSGRSRWVTHEVMLADDLGKPMFPLLLEGDLHTSELWALFIGKQYTDVRAGQLPDDGFFTRLAAQTPPKMVHGTDVMERGNSAARQPRSHSGSKVYELLPTPFGWVNIPEGQVTLTTQQGWAVNYIREGTSRTLYTSAFVIAKYPVTNAQFRKFMEADGYENQRWWTAEGWEIRQKEQWVQPRYWSYKLWNQPDHPAVGVSWFEATAFCLWLSEQLGEEIRLPTEQEWQRAAQGDDRRPYPWGQDWDALRCNNSVQPFESKQTSSVIQYAGQDKGDSFYGVVDMVGNVWEWCLTDYETGRQDSRKFARYRTLRGGSWVNLTPDCFRTDYRFKNFPLDRFNNGGFRLARSL